jgi:hypothetical protein
MRLTVCLVLAFLMTPMVVAHAETEQPWAIGVTEQQKAQAQKLLEEGNVLFLAKNYAEALEKYKSAVGAWDHPAIRFNMVRCLIQLDRPVDASDNLALALKYGAAPMEEAVYSEALSYQKLLANQIGDLDVHCEQGGVKVTLDGQPLLNCPGKEHRRVAPGQHQLVGTKDGFLTKTTEVVVLGAKTQDSKIELVPLGKAAKVVHRWATWVPWTVFGGGLVLAGIGGVLQYQASQDMSSYDSGVSTYCSGVGCASDDPRLASVNDFKTRAQTENKVAVSVMTVGFATAVIGGVMLYMNRGRTVYEGSVEKQGPQVGFTPTHDGGVMSLSGHF